MKKALIITLFGNYNFGNKLQNYAMQQILESMDLSVSTATVSYHYTSIYYNIKKICKIFLDWIFMSTQDRKRLKRFVQFNDEHLTCTKNKYRTNKARKNSFPEFDYYIYGSDQIWNPSCFGTSDLFLGYYGFKNRNIVYAASIGISELQENLIDRYRKGFRNFNSISVREEAAINIIKGISKEFDVACVLDPTLLLNQEEWEELIDNNIHYKEYILIYFLGEMPDGFLQDIKSFAAARELDIINIMDKTSKYYVSGPKEFLYYERNAALICTDSYHACLFAFQFNRPLLIFERQGVEKMNSRIDTFIKTFGLENCLFKDSLTDDVLKIDYSNGLSVLDKKRKNSMDYLKNAINKVGR